MGSTARSTAQSRRRRQGPPTRDREVTRATILAVAEQEFARHGLVAARTEEIAERSGVTKGMIYHYFGSKEKLYEAALEQVFAPLLMSLQQFAAPDSDPEQALEGVVRRILELSAGGLAFPPCFSSKRFRIAEHIMTGSVFRRSIT